MKNAIVYSFHVRDNDIKNILCYKQLRYSIDTLRKFNSLIPVYVYISPSNINVLDLGFGENVSIVSFDSIDDGGWPEEWVYLGYLEFLKHRWENAIDSIYSYELDNILYLDTDTVFHGDPELLFNKYGSTNNIWAKPDNSDHLMERLGVVQGMNDGQFILSKEAVDKNILKHMKTYVGQVLPTHKNNLTEQEYKDLCWISTQYSVWDYFKNKGNIVKYFDEEEVMLHVEPEHKNTDRLIVHHYYSGNTHRFLPEIYL